MFQLREFCELTASPEDTAPDWSVSLGSEAGLELPVLCVFLNMDLWIFTSLHPFIVSEFLPSGFTSCFIVKFSSLCDCFSLVLRLAVLLCCPQQRLTGAINCCVCSYCLRSFGLHRLGGLACFPASVFPPVRCR